MKNNALLTTIILLFLGGIGMSLSSQGTTTDSSAPQEEAAKNSEQVRSVAAFDVMMQALTHQRCLNCHPSGDRPRQGEDSHIHYFNVQRGPDDHGVAALQCSTCHQEENNDNSGVPGAPHWGLAPKSMAWEGLSRVEIAEVMMNPEKNGGKNLEEIVKHLTEDELVLWAWEPGVDDAGVAREKPPVSKDAFIAAVKEWAATGAIIPSE